MTTPQEVSKALDEIQDALPLPLWDFLATIRNHIAALEQRAEAAEANARLLASSLQGAFAALDMEAPPAVQAAIDAARGEP